MTKLCGYIQWSRYQNLSLVFPPTEEDQRYCLAVGDAKLYYNSYGLEELWKLSAYEFLNHLMEFSAILNKTAHFNHQPFFSKYFKMHFH